MHNFNFDGKKILFMNNLDKEKSNICKISKYLYIILTAVGVYFLIDGNRILGAILYLVSFIPLVIANRKQLSLLNVVIVVICALVILYVGILRYF